MSNVGFKVMALGFKVRDALKPRERIVKEIGLKPGFSVIDFGCGPGGYVPATSKAIGENGKLYALDINPAAIEMVNKLVAKNGLKNVEIIQSSGDTHLPAKSIDVVLLFDVFHDLKKQNEVLAELYRILKNTGLLAFSDHHLSEDEITSKVTESGLFMLHRKGENIYLFTRQH